MHIVTSTMLAAQATGGGDGVFGELAIGSVDTVSCVSGGARGARASADRSWVSAVYGGWDGDAAVGSSAAQPAERGWKAWWNSGRRRHAGGGVMVLYVVGFVIGMMLVRILERGVGS